MSASLICDCGGGHAVSVESPSGHAITCPTRTGEAVQFYEDFWQALKTANDAKAAHGE